MRIALVPRTSEFYDLFARAGANALEAARLAERRFREYPNPSVSQTDIKAIETAGDAITRDLIQLLNTQYVTPFDREDIYDLATAIDDVVDHIEESTDLLELYGVESPTRHALDQCAILVKSVEQLSIALGNLKGMRNVQAALVQVKQLEDEGDRAVRAAIAALIVIRWKDIYEALEAGLDAAETAANVLGNNVVKNA